MIQLNSVYIFAFMRGKYFNTYTTVILFYNLNFLKLLINKTGFFFIYYTYCIIIYNILLYLFFVIYKIFLLYPLPMRSVIRSVFSCFLIFSFFGAIY